MAVVLEPDIFCALFDSRRVGFLVKVKPTI
jgi:hypothetical protein